MPSVLFEVKNSIAFVSLNRPEKYNAFNRDMSKTLQEVLDQCEESKQIRCVYLTGSGKAFSSGQDLTEVIDPDGPDTHTIISEFYNPIIKKIRNLSKPVVAAINGAAAGAGANIGLSADIVVAARSAFFVQAFSKIGLIPDCGGTYFLPRLIGLQKTLALTMLGDKVSADEAERIGMIYKVFDDHSFAEESMNIAMKLAQLPTKALAFTKQAINKSLSNNLEDQLNTEEVLQIKAGRTNDFKEGVAAFLEKRTPVFKGE
jgi:2-(1,2-epoxy-1,2-dihydrophenyl)acetyl-CoA isomerase